MGANQGFLRPTGNLARREKTVPSPAPSQWETTPYPSNDLREGLTNSSARPSPAALRSPLTPAKAMKTAAPAPVQPVPRQTPLTEEDWQLERPRRLIRRAPEKTSPSMAFRLLEDRPVPDQPEKTTWEEGTAPVPVTLPQEEIPPVESERALGASPLDDALFSDLLQNNPDITGSLEDPEDWPEDGEDALPDDQIPEPASVPVSLFPESRPRRKWPWIAAGTALLLTAGGAALWKTGLWARLLERLS